MIDRQATQPKDRDDHEKILKILKCTFGLIKIGEKYFEWWAGAAAGSLPPQWKPQLKSSVRSWLTREDNRQEDRPRTRMSIGTRTRMNIGTRTSIGTRTNRSTLTREDNRQEERPSIGTRTGMNIAMSIGTKTNTSTLMREDNRQEDKDIT